MSVQSSNVQYRLPCTCGKSVLVNRSQAGLAVQCECGAKLDVPTIRGLGSLEQVARERAASGWGNRQAVLLIGLMIAVVGFGLGGYRQLFPPKPPFTSEQLDLDMKMLGEAIQQVPANEVWQMWEGLRAGLDRSEFPAVVKHRVDVERNQRWMWTFYATGIVGLLIAASSRVIR